MSSTYIPNSITVPNGGITLSNTTATSGAYITTGTNGTYAWQNPADNVMVIKPDPASLEVKGKVIINGQDLEERLKTIEKVLTIPERDVKLEAKHPKLKKMHDDYIKELSKYRMWESIKGEEE
jgi:predicted transcriptional regulator